jgi:hypothetical protein
MSNTVVGLFIPVYHREAKVRACFDALVRMHQDRRVDLHVRVGFNGGSPTLFEYINDGVPMGWCDSYAVCNPGGNTGKGAIVNRMVSELADFVRVDYVISLDSDIIVRAPYWVERFVDAFLTCPRWKDLGGLSAQQDGECCHVLTNNPETFDSAMKVYNYTVVPENEGVAGGAILTPYHVWRTLGGYRAHRIYASDDADYMLACAQHNLLIPVVNNDVVTVFHPPGDDPEYRGWKLRAAREKLSLDETNGFYEGGSEHAGAV